jgi:hypothetical protein
MKVGFSFGRCIRDIVKGDVKLEDVIVIVARTRMPELKDVEWVVDEYMYRDDYLYGLDREQCQNVAKDLFNTGRIHQPRMFGARPVIPGEDHIWMDLMPTRASDNETVQSAWEQYQLVLKLVNGIPTAPKDL